MTMNLQPTTCQDCAAVSARHSRHEPYGMMDKREKRIIPSDGLPSNNKKTGVMSRENRIKTTSRKKANKKVGGGQKADFTN
jgi:hypothetical protein